MPEGKSEQLIGVTVQANTLQPISKLQTTDLPLPPLRPTPPRPSPWNNECEDLGQKGGLALKPLWCPDMVEAFTPIKWFAGTSLLARSFFPFPMVGADHSKEKHYLQTGERDYKYNHKHTTENHHALVVMN